MTSSPRLLVHLLCRLPELPANLFFGRVQRVLQLLGRCILVGPAIAEDMLPQLVETDRLPPRLRIQPGEVGDELRFFRIQMEWDAILFPPGTRSVRLSSLSYAGY